MSRVVLATLLVLGLTALYPAVANAQLPPATPAQEAAGLTVAHIQIEPGALEITRGDTVRLRAVMHGRDGSVVPGAQALFFSPSRAVRGQGIVQDETIVLIGREPGEASIAVLVRVPSDSANFQGIGGIKQMASIPVTVKDWAVAKVEIEKPTYMPYVGSTFKLHAMALTDHGTEHSTAKVAWRSENPAVASITPGGVVTPNKPGTVALVASTESGASAQHTMTAVKNPTARLAISPKTTSTRTGDVVHLDVQALDDKDKVVEGLALAYSVFGIDSAGAMVYPDGEFVAESPGAYRVVASTGGKSAEAIVEVNQRPPPTPARKVGQGVRTEVSTSDLWVFAGQDGRDYAYTGTHAQGGGQRMFVWDVTDPASIQLIDSVVVDARVVNDVKVSEDASWAIITREGASNRQNGIVVLDLADPAHPTVIAELTDQLTSGIHNVWIIGTMVYAVNDGTSSMNILDLSDPANPKHAGHWEIRPGESNKTLHDVWSDGSYLYLSYWNDGLVILDISGKHGGTASEPKFVSSIAYGQGNTHVAWREGDYVFVGDEIFGCPECINGPRGYIHVMDVSDIENPKEVGKFEVPEAGTHNIWVEDGVLYIAYYQGGLRIVDVSGELRGDLYRQGRQIGWIQTAAGEGQALVPNSPMAWGPQPFKGHIFVSDMNSGLWAVKHDRPQQLVP
jgi:hypothetical protein